LSEAVIWPAARGHSLATVLVLAALVAGRSRRLHLVVTLLLMVAALLAKETALLPLLLLPLLLPARRGRWRPALAAAVVGAAFVVFNLLVKPSFYMPAASFGERLLKVPFVLLRPIGLADWYGFRWWQLVVVLLMVVALVVLLRSSRLGLVGLLWIALNLIPVVLLPKLSSRYLYLPGLGYALVLAAVLEVVWSCTASGRARRLLCGLLGLLLAVVCLGNVIDIQREIGDYRMLAEPYAKLVEVFREPVQGLGPDQTLVVVDIGPRDQIWQLTERVFASGNMVKLIPYRPTAVAGLIELVDLVNLIRAGRGGLAFEVDEPVPEGSQWLVYDGEWVVSSEPLALGQVPAERVSRIRFGPPRQFFAR